jgi:VanZ like family
VVHLLVVAWFALRPLSVPWVYAPNVRPLASINRAFLNDPVAGARTIASGLLLLAPLGVLLPMVSGNLRASALGSLTRTVFLGAATSFAIECLQTCVPGRVFDVDSILLNTAGVAIAHLAVVPRGRAWLRGRAQQSPRQSPQRSPQRAAAASPRTAPHQGPVTARDGAVAGNPDRESGKTLMTATLPTEPPLTQVSGRHRLLG